MTQVNAAAKCPKCGNSPTQTLQLPVPDPLDLYCLKCDLHWTATKQQRERVIGLMAGILASGA
jgi:hypothetical protein